jgi:hypothetical protein
MNLHGMIYIQSFVKIGSGIQVILRVVFRQCERLQCWYAVDMVSGGTIYIPTIMTVDSDIRLILWILHQQSKSL